MSAFKVLVTRRLDPVVLEPLRDAELTIWEQTGILSTITESIDVELLDIAGANLRVVANMAAGYDNIDVAECSRRGIVVCNTPGVLAESTAEYTMALMLATTRRLFEAEHAVRAGEWPRWDPTWMCGADLQGLTLGIVGLGEIGRAVARRAAAFDMVVIHSGRADGLDLFDLLRRADVVSIHCPLNESTTGLIGASELATMKPTSILINTARGGIVDEIALERALRIGTIRAAALDVMSTEPIPIDHPLLSLRNCTVLPHIGSATWRTRERMGSVAAGNIAAVIAGSRPLSRVNDIDI
jgi:glyoxylate reductase